MKLKIIGVWNITYRRVDKQDEKEEKKEALKWNWREKKSIVWILALKSKFIEMEKYYYYWSSDYGLNICIYAHVTK